MTIHERPFGRFYEDFEPGDVYQHWPGKTITEADDHLFCMITMNHHPLHTDAWFAETQTQFGKNVVVGNLVYSLVLGMSVPDVSGAAIANLEVEELKHKRPTFHGDTIYAETKVLEKRESSSRPDRGVVTVETRGLQPARRRGLLLPAQGDGARSATRRQPRQRPYTSPRVARRADGRWRPAASSARSSPGSPGALSCSTTATWSRSSTTGRCSRPHARRAARARRDPARPRRALRDDLFAAGPGVAAAVQDAMGAQGSFVAMNNVVSQSVPHLHVHAVPRNRKDGLRGFFWPRQRTPTTPRPRRSPRRSGRCTCRATM